MYCLPPPLSVCLWIYICVYLQIILCIFLFPYFITDQISFQKRQTRTWNGRQICFWVISWCYLTNYYLPYGSKFIGWTLFILNSLYMYCVHSYMSVCLHIYIFIQRNEISQFSLLLPLLIWYFFISILLCSPILFIFHWYL